MTKRGIEAHTDYDSEGRWQLIIEKKRGKLTLGEIKATARDWEWDYYLLVLDCFHDDSIQFAEADPVGDIAVLYRTDLFYEKGEH